MATYGVSVSNNNIKIDVTSVKNSVNVSTPKYSVSLARTGGQGSKGDSVTNAYIDSEDQLILEVSNSLGEVIETINAGTLVNNLHMEDLRDVEFVALEDKDYLAYDLPSQTFVNHKLTTSRVLDIDNTNKQDGALLVYNGTTEKYTATRTLSNQNTTIIGGSY